MLKFTPVHEHLRFEEASAEHLPFPDQLFDLVTVSSGVHWFDIDVFLAECVRTLKNRGWLILYENYFWAEMVENDAFQPWVRGTYLDTYPSPPRNRSYDWAGAHLRKKGVSFVHEERFKNEVIFSRQELILYLTTQSNITAAVAEKGKTYHEIETWLDRELTAFFPTHETRQKIYFGNWIKYLQKRS